MKQQITFTPTEARQNFFNLLKLASQGKNILIKTKEALFAFKLEEIGEKPTREKMKALEDITKLNIKSLPVKKIKKILDLRLNPS